MSTDDSKPNKTSIVAALIGNPNTGKSTLFSALAGMNAHIGNYPGVTVEKKVGHLKTDSCDIQLVDLPGTYSLSPRSLDEMVSVDLLLGRMDDIEKPDVVICIVDASNLERNFYLFSQVLDLGIPAILVLNQIDVAERSGMTIDVEQLKQRLDIPIVVTQAHKNIGIDDLKAELLKTLDSREGIRLNLFPEEFNSGIEKLKASIPDDQKKDWPDYILERVLLDVNGESENQLKKAGLNETSDLIDPLRLELREAGCPIPAIEPKVRYQWSRELLMGVLERQESKDKVHQFSDKMDWFLTHWFFGFAVFILMMFAVFQMIYTGAVPLMDTIDGATSFVADGVSSFIPPGMLRSLLVDGIIAGVGGVIIFLPQIILLFLFIAILEDCGYMSRAAFLMDRLMTKVGLTGKSFVPLMSSFACAVPGIMGARTIESSKDRLVTILVAPLMSCSARLPVYVLMIGAFIPAQVYLGGWVGLQGMILFGMSALGAVVAIPIAWLLKTFWFPGEPAPFVMELPTFKWPSPRVTFSRVYDRAKTFIVDAGTLIFCASVVVWAASYFPGDHTELHQTTAKIEQLEKEAPEMEALQIKHQKLSGELLESSFLGRAGKIIEPAVKPLGWDWKIGVGAIASFPAREVIIATLGTIYSLGGDIDMDDDESKGGLVDKMKQSKWSDGRPVFNIPVALSVMVFFALCAQCAATLMVIKRETNGWFYPIFTFAYMTALGYVGALLTYQISYPFFMGG